MNKQPRSNDDKDLDAEIEQSLQGLNLQHLDLGGPRSEAAAKPGPRGKSPRPEARSMRGTIAGISGDDVIVELGPRMQGVISLREFAAPPKLGEAQEFVLRGQEDGLWLLTRQTARSVVPLGELVAGSKVKAKVTGQNTGGLELKIGAIAAFMPASQVALQREEQLAQYIGQELICQVLEVDELKGRVLLSRRAALEEERMGSRQETLGSLAAGQTVRGKVTRVEAFGAFVDLGGGVEGLLHVSNISHVRTEDARTALEPGKELELKILEIKEGGKRIGLGRKQLEADPWIATAQKLVPEQVVSAKVTRLMDFGAFCELAPGVEGLLHVSQLLGGGQRVRRVQDVLKPGQVLSLRIVNIDPAQKRIGLSRLDSRGALIGSEDAVETGAIKQLLDQGGQAPSGTNLGNLFRKALEK